MRRTILLVDWSDDRQLAINVRSTVDRAGISCTNLEPHLGASQTQKFPPGALLLIILPKHSSDQNLQRIGELSKHFVVVAVLSDGVSTDLPAKLFEVGVRDYAHAPLLPGSLLPRVLRILEDAKADRVAQRTNCTIGLEQLIGESEVFLSEIQKIPTIAKYDVAVLITGETGTGKELCARAIHCHSPRSFGPFVPVNCGALPVDLVESELFGHEAGAFTGAVQSKKGLIEEAHGGTLFLDEIDSLPSLAQVKLLRFLQENEFRRLGSTRTVQSNARVVAATNADIPKVLDSDRLRQDLYFRLDVIPLTLPPLRERRPDIVLLARHFLEKWAKMFDKNGIVFSEDAISLLLNYEWPGNVRELEHVVQRAVLLTNGVVIRGEAIIPSRKNGNGNGNGMASFRHAKLEAISKFEKSYLTAALLAASGNISKASSLAGKNRRAFFELLRKHSITTIRLVPLIPLIVPL